MKAGQKIIAATLAIGLLVWVEDALFDCFFFHKSSFVGQLIADVPAHEIYMRSVIVACLLTFGIIVSRVVERLRRSESELRAIYENAPIVMLLVDRVRRVVKLNSWAASMAQRSAKEAAGLRAGEAMRCLHTADDPKGCGFGSACAACGVNNTVLRTFQLGKAAHRVETSIPYDHPDGPVEQVVAQRPGARGTNPLRLDIP